MSDVTEEDGIRALAYVHRMGRVLAEERDLALVLGALTTLVSLTLTTNGVSVEAFSAALVQSMAKIESLIAARTS